MRVDHPGDALPAGGLEVEFDRASHVQPDQRELGGGAAGELSRIIHSQGKGMASDWI
jgi:hypothetical protein